MSVIGNYVHAFGYNYVRYGTNRIRTKAQSEPPSISLRKTQESLQKRKNRLGASSKTAALEDHLNQFIDKLGNPKGIENDEERQAYAKMQRALAKMIGLEWDQAKKKINFTSLNVSGVRGLGSIKLSTQHYAGRQDTYEQIIISRVNKLNEKMQKLTTTVSKMQFREGDIERVDAEIQEVYKMAQDTEKYISSIIKNVMPGQQLNTQQQNLVKRLNELIRTYAPFVDDANKKGKIFEYAIQLASMAPAELAKQSVDEIISNTLNSNQGSKTNYAGYARSRFIKGMTNKEKGALGWKTEQLDEYNSFTTRTKWSQQKIDVEIMFKGQKQKISAKNFNLNTKSGNLSKGKQISLTSGNPLLSMIQDEDPGFVNHYFNLFAQQYDMPSIVAMRGFNGLRMQYINMLKSLIIYKALTGEGQGKLKSENAEVFVINNNKAGVGQKHVRVINIKEIINYLDKIDSSKMVVRTTPEVLTANHRYTNEYIPGNNSGTLRIRIMLFEAHAAKVHAAIKSGVIADLAK